SALSLTVSGGEIIGRADGSAGLTLSVYDLEGHRVARTSTADATISLRLADLPSGLLLIDLQGPGGNSRRLKLLN
ncbi:MAG: T9SS type A sorting domain-containing protein, partial [Muribaculaceae bacterium]|nr:T9SS type A sorting domain-containing protein [Muribaculaceae bacterium]